MKVFLLAGAFLILQQGQSAEKKCPAKKVHWNKCQGDLTKASTGVVTSIKAQAPKKDECYTWTGEAEFKCQDGIWIPTNKKQSCNWDCICCY